MSRAAMTHSRRALNTDNGLGLLVVAVTLMAALPRPVLARVVQLRTASSDTVRGVVYDSLSMRPLAGANVMADPGGQSTRTDDAGRFTLISPARIERVTAFHLTLDRTGIGSISGPPPSVPGTRMMLSTPSALTAWRRLCPGMPRPAQREGVVFGTVRGSDGTTRIAGARVRVSWDLGPADAATGIRQFEVRTDSVGSYYACGVPAGENAYIVTYSSQYVSGSIAIAGDSLPLRKLDLFAGRLADAKAARAPTTALVTGFVRDAGRRPVVDAIVDIDGTDLSTKTDAGGRFRFVAVPTGSRMVLIRGVGFVPTLQPIDVLEKGTEEVNVELQRSTVLPGVKVTERLAVPILRAEFDERKRIGFGTFLDTADVARKFNMRNLFEGVPSLEVTGQDNTAFRLFTPVLHMTGSCPANIYLDGRKSDTEELQALPKDLVAAVEIYIRQPNAPARYRPTDNACGVVIVWTKYAFSKK
jgi:hypothetical protein